MVLASLALWIGGVVLIVLAVFQARGPFSRMAELDNLAENARRYDSWRGARRPSTAEAPTGADVMRQVLRRKVLLWAGVAAVGVVLIIAGFALR
ncbi:hypothetical protein BH24CHL6_BH24CHL6_07460 [soil metagenome]